MNFGNGGAPAPMGSTVGTPTDVISLAKGQRIDLSKTAPTLTEAVIGLGWQTRQMVGKDFDLDASLFLLDSNNRANGIESFIFYNNKIGAGGAIKHMGDNLVGGDGAGDDEQIVINFSAVPMSIAKMVVAITIFEYEERKQNFGMVSKAFARVVDNTTGKELVRFNLGEDFSVETAVIAVEFYRGDTGWKMSGVAQGYAGGLKALATSFGLNVG